MKSTKQSTDPYGKKSGKRKTCKERQQLKINGKFPFATQTFNEMGLKKKNMTR